MELWSLRIFGPIAVLLCVFMPASWSMECYVCTKQDGNADKCLKTIKTCEQSEDTCLTEIRWGSTPYWDEGAKKQYYVSKRCATREDCEETRSSFMPYCHRIWYEDWKCAECCQGDRCNYYAFLGASTVHFNMALLISGAVFTFIYYQYFV